MKQRILLAGIGVLLVALILLFVLKPSVDSPPETTIPSTGATAGVKPPSNSVTRPPHVTRPTIVVPPEPGVVRLYTCDVELYKAYLELAEAYTQKTGNLVEVLAPGGDSCEQTLEMYMEQEEKPTVFCLHTMQAAENWQYLLYDLQDSALAAGLINEAFALELNNKIVAVPAEVEGLGIVYNASLLALSGYSRGDFVDFSSFASGVKHITDYKKDLGFYAFGQTNFKNAEHDGLACLLSLLYGDSDEMRSFVDLYSKGANKSGDPLEDFLQGKSVFYLAGSRDYEKLAGISTGAQNLDILPAYSAGGGTLEYVCDHYWAVNGQSSAEDLEASLWFMQWLVTASGSDIAPVDRLGMLSPYRDAAHYNNILEKKLREYMATEAVSVVWERCAHVEQEDLQALSDALADYVSNPTDTKWAAVEALLIHNQKAAGI